MLSIPDAQGRYYLLPMLDAWTMVFEVPGKRTTGTGPQTDAITGPEWSGTHTAARSFHIAATPRPCQVCLRPEDVRRTAAVTDCKRTA